MDGQKRTLTFRLMVMNQEDKVVVPGSPDGNWELMIWVPSVVLRNEE